MMNILSRAAVAALALVAVPATATTYDATTDFSTTSPTGTWSYGFGTLGTSFAAATTFTSFASGAVGWQPSSTTSSTPLVSRLSGPAPANGGSAWIPNDRLVLHPGPTASEDAIVRFTAPSAGVYAISGMFGIIDYGATGVVVAAFGPSGQLFSQQLNFAAPGFGQYGDRYDFAQHLTLAAGDSLSFGVRNGGFFFNDSTAFALSIREVGGAVPEPASWALLIAGFGLVGAVARRRQAVRSAA